MLLTRLKQQRLGKWAQWRQLRTMNWMLELVLFANVIDLQTLTVRFEPFISTSQQSMPECYVTKVYRLSTLKRGKFFPENQKGSGRIRFGWLVLSSRRKTSCLGHKRETEAQVKTFSHKKIVIFHFHSISKCLKSLSSHFIHCRY